MGTIKTVGQLLRHWRLQDAEWKEVAGNSKELGMLATQFLGNADKTKRDLSADELVTTLCAQRCPILHEVAQRAGLVHRSSSIGRLHPVDSEHPRECYRDLLADLVDIFKGFSLRDLLTWHVKDCNEEQKTAVRRAFEDRLQQLSDKEGLHITLDDKRGSGQKDFGNKPLATENLEALTDVIINFRKKNPKEPVSLHLEHCGLEDKHIDSLARLLKEQALSRLEIPRHQLTQQGLKQLAEAVVSSGLISLDLSHSPHLDDHLSSFVRTVKTNPSLYELTLVGCNLSPATRRLIKEELPQEDFGSLQAVMD